MMRILSGILAATVLVGPVQADDRPRMIRVHVEYIELPHRELTRVTETSRVVRTGALHQQLRALVDEEKARILETTILTTPPGQKATVESICEYIYPSEYEPSGLGSLPVPQNAAGLLDFPVPLRPIVPPAFETRNLGVTLEIEPNLGALEGTVDLRVAPEIVNYLRLEEWMEHKDRWGNAGYRLPIFETLRVSTGIVLQEGLFSLLCIHTPTRPEGGPAEELKIAVFVKASVLMVGPPIAKEE